MKPYDPAPRRLTRMVSIALLVLGAAGAAGAAQPPGEVNLDDVPVGQALSVLAESYGMSVAIGALPDTRVTVHLKGISAEEAFAAVAAAAGLTVVREGAVVRVAPKGAEAAAIQIVPAVFPPGEDANLDGLREAGVQAHKLGQGSVLLAGGKSSVEVVAAALGKYRQSQIETRLFHLGASPGEETLKAVLPLLDSCAETATFNAAENVLVVSALPATLERVGKLLDVLIRTQAQYEIEVQVVEVSESTLRQMGAQGSIGLDIRGGVLATTFPLRGLRDARRFLPSANDLATISRLGSAGGLTSATEPGSFADPGFRFGQIDARGVGLTIQALEQAGKAKVIATPRVTALDNRQARISMVTTLRIPTYTQNQAFATTTVTGIEQVDVGTTLDVRPRRGNGREIVLKVAPEVSELQPGSSTFSQSGLTQGLPVVTRRRTETEVILESGETLVIGGLSIAHDTQTNGKTPGLGSIPVIGRMFRLEGKQTDSTVLLVFVTPRELPPPEERRAKVRVGESWIPAPLASRLEGARALLRGQGAAERVAGVRALEAADAELLAAGIDAGADVAALENDPGLDVRTAAALFFLHTRPADALAELARFKDGREVAAAALAAPLAPHLRALLAGLAGKPDPETGSGAAEPALAWSGAPAEIALAGDAAGTRLVREALGLLARRTPDLRHLVGLGLGTVEAGEEGPAVDPAARSARVTTGGATAQSVALQLVRFATLVFESRVHGLPAAGERGRARALREETAALERLTGGRAPAATPAARDALRAGLLWIADDSLVTAVGPFPANPPTLATSSLTGGSR